MVTIPTIYKTGDDWGIVYDIVLTTLPNLGQNMENGFGWFRWQCHLDDLCLDKMQAGHGRAILGWGRSGLWKQGLEGSSEDGVMSMHPPDIHEPEKAHADFGLILFQKMLHVFVQPAWYLSLRRETPIIKLYLWIVVVKEFALAKGEFIKSARRGARGRHLAVGIANLWDTPILQPTCIPANLRPTA